MGKINRIICYLSKMQALPSAFPPYFRGFKFIRRIGSGSFGSVFLAKRGGKLFAIKVVSDRRHALKEIQNLKWIRKFLPPHPNVVKYIASFIYSRKYHIVMEYVDGVSLYDHLKPNIGKLDQAYFLPLVMQMLSAIQALHACDMVHLDIKFENFVIGRTGQVVLVDLGCSSLDGEELDKIVGTPLYMDPSLIHQNKGLNAQKTMDIWSIGINLICMYMGKAPLSLPHGLKEDDMMFFIMMWMANLTKPPVPTKLQDDKTQFGKFICDISTRCLQLDPTLRPTAAEILELVKAFMNP